MQYPVAPTPGAPRIANGVQPDPGARGFTVDLSRIAASQAGPQIPERGFIAQAGANYGGALESIGNETSKLYQAHVESVTQGQVLDAEAGLQAARDNIAAKLAQEPNTLKWQGLASDEATKFISENLANKDLTPQAKGQITAMYNRWQQTEVASVNLQAAKESFRQTGEKAIGAAVDLQSQGRFVEAGQIFKDVRAKGYVPDDTGAHLEAANQKLAKQAVEDAQFEQGYKVAKADPWKFDEVYPEPSEHMPARVYDRLKAEAEQQKRVIQTGQIDSFYGAMEQGLQPGSKTGIKVDADIDPWIEKNTMHLTEKEKKQFHTTFRQQTNVEHMADVKNRGPEIFSELWSQADAVTPQTSPEEYGAIRQRIGELPVNMRNKLNQKIDAKWQGKVPPLDNSVTSWGQQMLDSMLRGKAFGDYMVQAKDDKGKPRKRDDGSPIMVRDEAAYQKALSQKAKVGGQFHRLAVANPKLVESFANGDPKAVDEAAKMLNGIMPDGIRATWIDKLYGTMPPVVAPVTSPSSNAGPAKDSKSEEKGESLPEQNETDDPGDGLPSVDEPTLFPTEGDPSMKGGESMFPKADPGTKTRPIGDGDIKKAPKAGLTVIDPDTGEWMQVTRDELKKKAYLLPK